MSQCVECGAATMFMFHDNPPLCCSSCALQRWNKEGCTLTYSSIEFNVPPGCAHMRRSIQEIQPSSGDAQ